MTAPRLPWALELRRRGAREVGPALGLTLHDHPPSLSPCPACGADTRHTKRNDPRAAVNLTLDGGGWYCLQCERKGDAVKLAGWILLGREPRGSSDLAAVRAACAAKGLCAGRPGAPAPVAPRLPIPATPAGRRPEHLPAAEVAAFWEACLPIIEDAPSMLYLLRRYGPLGYAAEDFAGLHDVVRATPLRGLPAWWPAGWVETYRIVVPAYSGRGELRGVQARSISDVPRETSGFGANAAPPPKTRWPKLRDTGFTVSGLLFADKLGAAVLVGHPPRDLARVLVVEGLTDTVRASLAARRSSALTAVLGVESGAASALRAPGRRWPRLAGRAPVPCVVATDPDKQGARYFDQVREALPAWVPVAPVLFNKEE